MNNSSSIDLVQAKFSNEAIPKAQSQLDEQGFALIRSALDTTQIRSVSNWLDEIEALGTNVPDEFQPQFEDSAQLPRLRKLRRLFWNDPAFWSNILEYSAIFDFARRVVPGSPSLILHASFLKPAHTGSAITPHQDRAFWMHPYPGAVTIWIAIDSATTSNGCLEMYPGSHKMGTLPHESDSNSPWHDTVDPRKYDLKSQKVPMMPGDALAWHADMLHSSAPNHSNDDRRGMVLVFADSNTQDFKSADIHVLQPTQA